MDQIVAAARHRGLSQAALARRVGLTPVGLSKAKHRGDIRASTLARLAEAVDLELALLPRAPRQEAVEAIRRGRFFQTRDRETGGKEH